MRRGDEVTDGAVAEIAAWAVLLAILAVAGILGVVFGAAM